MTYLLVNCSIKSGIFVGIMDIQSFTCLSNKTSDSGANRKPKIFWNEIYFNDLKKNAMQVVFKIF